MKYQDEIGKGIKQKKKKNPKTEKTKTQAQRKKYGDYQREWGIRSQRKRVNGG